MIDLSHSVLQFTSQPPTPTMGNLTVTMTLTPEEQTALYDAVVLRAQTLEGNLPGSDRSVVMNRLAACLIDQMGYPVPHWMTLAIAEAV